VNPRDGNRPGSIGIPIPGTEVKIQSIDSGTPCATGETGKILVKGDGVMAGYLNNVEESHLRLQSGWYDTGDLGCLDEDGIYLAQRQAQALRENWRRNDFAGVR
jgi:long-subunit acyl-CoA synthetase (AMP-forming)